MADLDDLVDAAQAPPSLDDQVDAQASVATRFGRGALHGIASVAPEIAEGAGSVASAAARKLGYEAPDLGVTAAARRGRAWVDANVPYDAQDRAQQLGSTVGTLAPYAVAGLAGPVGVAGAAIAGGLQAGSGAEETAARLRADGREPAQADIDSATLGDAAVGTLMGVIPGGQRLMAAIPAAARRDVLGYAARTVAAGGFAGGVGAAQSALTDAVEKYTIDPSRLVGNDAANQGAMMWLAGMITHGAIHEPIHALAGAGPKVETPGQETDLSGIMAEPDVAPATGSPGEAPARATAGPAADLDQMVDDVVAGRPAAASPDASALQSVPGRASQDGAALVPDLSPQLHAGMEPEAAPGAANPPEGGPAGDGGARDGVAAEVAPVDPALATQDPGFTAAKDGSVSKNNFETPVETAPDVTRGTVDATPAPGVQPSDPVRTQRPVEDLSDIATERLLRARDRIAQTGDAASLQMLDQVDAELLRRNVAPPGRPSAAQNDEAAAAITRAADEGATSETNETPKPTPAQQAAGNYRKGRIKVQGLDISIENPRGSRRSGVSPDGTPWGVQLSDHYGYIRRTEGQDGDQLDVTVGREPLANTVHVVDQVDADTGKPDEHKVFVGFPSQDAALQSYDSSFSDGRGPERRGAVTTMTMPEFKRWVATGNTRTPLHEQLAAALRDRLGQYGLRDVGLQLVDRLTTKGATSNGQYWRDIISIARDNPAGLMGHISTLGHEAVHALRDLGLFSPGEWRTVERWADAVGRKSKFGGKNTIDEDYAKWSLERRREEAFAHLHQDYMAGKTRPVGALGTLLRKVKNFWQSIGNWARGDGFQSMDEISRRIESGEIGARERPGKTTGLDKAASMRRPADDPRIARIAALQLEREHPTEVGPKFVDLARAEYHDLSAEQEARAVALDRAADQGYQIDKPYWVGSPTGGQLLASGAFDPARMHPDGLFGPAVYMSTEPSEARFYAKAGLTGQRVPVTDPQPRVFRVVPKAREILNAMQLYQPAALERFGVNRGSAMTGEEIYRELTSRAGGDRAAVNRQLQALGLDGVYHTRNNLALGQRTRNLALFDPANLRRLDAAFDPGRQGDNDLMASRRRPLDGLEARRDPERARALLNPNEAPHRAIGELFDDLYRQQHGGRHGDPLDPRQFNRMVERSTDEAQYQLDQPVTGSGWYDADIGRAFDITAQLIPELNEQPGLRVLHTAIAAATSYATKAKANWREAAQLTRHFVDHGKVIGANPLTGGPLEGPRGQSKTKTLAILDHLVNGVGDPQTSHFDRATRAGLWLLSPQTVADMRTLKAGVPGVVSRGGDLVSGKATDILLGAKILGPKAGSFMANLNGLKEVTLDTWMIRAFNRHFGTLTGPGAVTESGLVEVPRGQAERAAMERWVHEVAENLSGSPQDTQAVLWYYEQQLYDALGAGSKPEYFSHGAQEYVDRERARDAADGRGSELRRGPGLAGERHDRATEAAFSLRRETDRPLAAPVSLAGLEAGEEAQRDLYGRFGHLRADHDTTDELKFYNLDRLVADPKSVTDLLQRFGATAKKFSFTPGPNFKLPRLRVDGYDRGTVWIYDPGEAAGSFKDEAYTTAWRLSHELGHGISEPLIAGQFGASKREGRLGRTSTVTRGVPPKQIEATTRPLTLLEAQRAVAWEDVAFRTQRRLLERLGVAIDEPTFGREYNTNIADATYRVMTGRFGDPGERGFVPAAETASLHDILGLLERSEHQLARDQGREPTRGLDLDSWRGVSDQAIDQAIERAEAAHQMQPQASLRREAGEAATHLSWARDRQGRYRVSARNGEKLIYARDRLSESDLADLLGADEARTIARSTDPLGTLAVDRVNTVLPSLRRDQDSLGFYSALHRAVDALPQGRAPASQWRGLLANLKGVKRENILWRDVDNWLSKKSPKSSDREGVSDGIARHADRLGDFTKTDAFRSKGFGGLDVPAKTAVLKEVFAAAQNGQVRKAIIGAIPVDVMHVLRSQQLAPERLFDNEPMFLKLFSASPDADVPFGMKVATTLVNAAARRAAEVRGKIPEIARPLKNRRPTEIAFDHRHDPILQPGRLIAKQEIIDAVRRRSVEIRDLSEPSGPNGEHQVSMLSGSGQEIATARLSDRSFPADGSFAKADGDNSLHVSDLIAHDAHLAAGRMINEAAALGRSSLSWDLGNETLTAEMDLIARPYGVRSVAHDNDLVPRRQLEITAPMRQAILEEGQPLFSLRRDLERYSRERVTAARDFVGGVIRDGQMAATPMALGSHATRAVAKTWMNARTNAQESWRRLNDYLTKTFTDPERRQMFDAMSEASIHSLQGDDARAQAALGRLSPEQRNVVRHLENYGATLWQAAREAGMVTGDAIPHYVPHILLSVGEDGTFGRLGASGNVATPEGTGRNLRTTSPNLKRRYGQTPEQTEALGRVKFGDGVEIVRDIRSLPFALARIEDALAGRHLVDSIKRMSDRVGVETVDATGVAPEGYFTLDHPALKTVRYGAEWHAIDRDGNRLPGKYTTQAEAERAAPPDGDAERGATTIERIPIHIHPDFEGPLRAVLSRPNGPLYNGLMALKGKAMSVIMYSPLIHNEVEFGRAFVLMPGKMLTLRVYRDGYQFQHDKGYLGRGPGDQQAGALRVRQAISDGLRPIGHRGNLQDLTDVMSTNQLEPGRSWTATVIGKAVGFVSRDAELAVKRGIDRAGDIWHQTLLWDRVRDLQFGLYANLRDQMIAKGNAADVAGKAAAHLANRFAGALPREGMSDLARKVGNIALFSRTFTLGNLGVFKDAISGLPRDVQGQLMQAGGEIARQTGNDLVKKAARHAVVLDIGLMYVMNAALQSGFAMLKRDQSLGDEAARYVERFHTELQRLRENPFEILNPFQVAEKLTPNSLNEEGRTDRALIGPNAIGQNVYLKNPFGKVGDDMVHWLLSPIKTLKAKGSTFTRPLLEVLENDQGFGQRVYNPDDKSLQGMFKAIGSVLWHLTGAQTPAQAIVGARDLLQGAGDPATNLWKTLGPLAGLQISHGARSGPERGLYQEALRREMSERGDAAADISRLIDSGKTDEAAERMRALGMSEKAIVGRTNRREAPRTTLSPAELKHFQGIATPEERQRYDALTAP